MRRPWRVLEGTGGGRCGDRLGSFVDHVYGGRWGGCWHCVDGRIMVHDLKMGRVADANWLLVLEDGVTVVIPL
jgi:hypothetical protein